MPAGTASFTDRSPKVGAISEEKRPFVRLCSTAVPCNLHLDPLGGGLGNLLRGWSEMTMVGALESVGVNERWCCCVAASSSLLIWSTVLHCSYCEVWNWKFCFQVGWPTHLFVTIGGPFWTNALIQNRQRASVRLVPPATSASAVTIAACKQCAPLFKCNRWSKVYAVHQFF